MQYPPQEQPPSRQPYAPSEIYMPEQPQTYAPQSQPPIQAQEIVIYPNRKQAMWRTIICVVVLFILVAMLVVIFILSVALAGPLQIKDVTPIIVVAFVIVLPAIAFVGWITWRMASQVLFTPKPLLLINHEGITVGAMPLLSGFFISWAEVAALHSSRYMYRYLCIVPKNPDQFLARFNSWERFSRRMNAVIGSPLYVPLMYLDKPVEEILQELYHRYANELHYYGVQLRP